MLNINHNVVIKLIINAWGKHYTVTLSDDIDRKYGFQRYTEPGERTGWLFNMHPVSCSLVCVCKLSHPLYIVTGGI